MTFPETTLVSGASSGIGRAIAAARSSLGELVIGLDIAKPSGTVDWTTELCDLSKSARLLATMQKITATHDITRVVNCAGIARIADLEELTPEDYHTTMVVNALAPAMIVKASLPAMKRRGFGRVVNITSRSAFGRALRTAYGGSKGALTTQTKVWALELAPFGITVNAIAPGPIETELYRAANPPESEVTKKVVASVPVGRLGLPEDVAATADFFLSEASGFVTGQSLPVCGGLTIGGVAQ